jgi:prepilin-type processing-associated H-X9-DG protein
VVKPSPLFLKSRSLAMSENYDERGGATGVCFTWRELVTVIVVFGVLGALLFPWLAGCPAVGAAREAARRMSCVNNLKQIGLAIHNYAQANKVFPPGTISTYKPKEPGNQYDILAEAAETGPGSQGTSFLLRIMPFIESDNIEKDWQFNQSISSSNAKSYHTNIEIANMDVKGFYCPTRRNGLRPGTDDAMKPVASWPWTGGGTDYGGCAGRHAAFTLETGYNLCDASTYYDPNYFPPPLTDKSKDEEKKRWGVFGRVNESTTFAEISDGLSNTIMTGELQRLTDVTPNSRDGWAIGGPCTLFTTGAMFESTRGGTITIKPVASGGRLMNNNFFGSPGSVHPNGANFGLADGSVRFLSTSIDPRVFAFLGSMADGEKVELK